MSDYNLKRNRVGDMYPDDGSGRDIWGVPRISERERLGIDY